MSHVHNIVQKIIVVFVLSAGTAFGALLPLQPDIARAALRCTDLIYKESFQEASSEAKKLIRQFPNHPAGYFFLAASIDAWMVYHESNKKEEEFYKYCDQAIEKGEAVVSAEPGNMWAKFFLGGAEGYKGTYEVRYGRMITAFQHGWKGVSLLMDIDKASPELVDVRFGIGTYDYWRSAMTSVLFWMPGVEDKRADGIKKLQEVVKNGTYTKITAGINLIKILNNEKRYDEAVAVSDQILTTYPGLMIVLGRKAEALAGLRQLDKAQKIYEYMLVRLELEADDNHYNAIICHFWLAKIAFWQKQYHRCLSECNRMEGYKVSESIRKRLGKYFDEIGDIKSQAKSAVEKIGTLPFAP